MAHQVITRIAAAIAFGLAAAAGADVVAVAAKPTAPLAAESPADATGSPPGPPPLYGSTVKCTTALPARDILAARMARDIAAALAGRADTVGLDVTDSRTGISCWDRDSRRFISASVIKLTILEALLHKLMAEHRQLTQHERWECWEMITDSDGDAATVLWKEVGMAGLQRLLELAGMTGTVLGRAGYWGLTEITAADEIRALQLITSPNAVLDQAAQGYARYLMDHVVAAQRWGVPAGAPPGVGVQVKNGWLPHPDYSDWRINSIGAFTEPGQTYLLAVLTEGNPTMNYGVRTIERAAAVIHRDLADAGAG